MFSPQRERRNRPSFNLDEVLMAGGVELSVSWASIQSALRRHRRGDWGDVSAEVRAKNENQFLVPAYSGRNRTRFRF